MADIQEPAAPGEIPGQDRYDFPNWSPAEFMRFVEFALPGPDNAATVATIREHQLDGDFIGHIAEETSDAGLLAIPRDKYKRLRHLSRRVIRRYTRQNKEHVRRLWDERWVIMLAETEEQQREQEAQHNRMHAAVAVVRGAMNGADVERAREIHRLFHADFQELARLAVREDRRGLPLEHLEVQPGPRVEMIQLLRRIRLVFIQRAAVRQQNGEPELDENDWFVGTRRQVEEALANLNVQRDLREQTKYLLSIYRQLEVAMDRPAATPAELDDTLGLIRAIFPLLQTAQRQQRQTIELFDLMIDQLRDRVPPEPFIPIGEPPALAVEFEGANRQALARAVDFIRRGMRQWDPEDANPHH